MPRRFPINLEYSPALSIVSELVCGRCINSNTFASIIKDTTDTAKKVTNHAINTTQKVANAATGNSGASKGSG
jgi:hypothetical protein